MDIECAGAVVSTGNVVRYNAATGRGFATIPGLDREILLKDDAFCMTKQSATRGKREFTPGDRRRSPVDGEEIILIVNKVHHHGPRATKWTFKNGNNEPPYMARGLRSVRPIRGVSTPCGVRPS